jgi:Regulator of chromosome condensation (RCC1) repeat
MQSFKIRGVLLSVSLGLVMISAGCGSSTSAPKDGAAGKGADGAAGGTPTPDAGGDTVTDLATTEVAPMTDVAADVTADSSKTDAAPDVATDGGSDSSNDAQSDGAVEAVSLSGKPYRTLALASGALHTCALLDDHSVKCWGENGYGQLGTGDTRVRGTTAAEMGNALLKVDLGTGRTATAISAARYVSCALLDDGSVKCWGLSSAVGLGEDHDRGDAPGEMGDNLPPLALGAGRHATQIASGYVASCALLDDGSARCWGVGAGGDIPASGVPTATPLGSTSKVRRLAGGGLGVLSVFEDGTVTGPLPAHTSSPATLVDGALVASVAGAFGQTGSVLADGTTRSLSVSSGASHLPPDGTASVQSIGVGQYDFSCAIFTGGAAQCWGILEGCAGTGTSPDYWCKIKPDSGKAVAIDQPLVALTSGGLAHICAIVADGSVRCWGGFEECSGAQLCRIPDKVSAELGASVDLVTTNGKSAYGAWRAVDLGTHP